MKTVDQFLAIPRYGILLLQEDNWNHIPGTTKYHFFREQPEGYPTDLTPLACGLEYDHLAIRISPVATIDVRDVCQKCFDLMDFAQIYKTPLILTPSDLADNFDACPDFLEEFKKKYPQGLDLSDLYGAPYKAEKLWQKLLADRLLRQQLSWAILAGLVPAKIRADLSDMDLSFGVFDYAILRSVNASASDLSAATLCNCRMGWINLLGANLADAVVEHSQLSHANLRIANLQGASFRRSNLDYCNLEGADLRGACFKGASMFETNLTDVMTDRYTDFDERELSMTQADQVLTRIS